jgi:DNA recombination protein RmuC
MEIVIVAVVGLLFLGIGLGVGFYLRKQAVDASSEAAAGAAREREGLASSLAAAQGEARALAARVAGLEAEVAAERRGAEERRAEAERTKGELRAEVQALAEKALAQQGGAMLDRSRERLEALLKPLGERIQAFERKVEETHVTDVRERSSLAKQLEGLQAAQQNLHRDAEALSRALTRDSKQQGNWGEIMLDRILETAGLAEGRDYARQQSHVDAEGLRKQPDVVVFLPEDRAVVVDAKCSITAFVAASASTIEAEREAHLKAHVASLRAHVKALSGKQYPELLRDRSPDFVLMFVPNEAAFLAALSREPTLYEDAFRQQVVLCSPTTLLAALRLVAQLWRTERQNENAREIAAEAGRLLDKLTGFVGNLDEVGDRLRQAQGAYDKAQKQLVDGAGSVMKKAEKIAELGAPVKSDKVRKLLDRVREDEGSGGGEEASGTG